MLPIYVPFLGRKTHKTTGTEYTVYLMNLLENNFKNLSF